MFFMFVVETEIWSSHQGFFLSEHFPLFNLDLLTQSLSAGYLLNYPAWSPYHHSYHFTSLTYSYFSNCFHFYHNECIYAIRKEWEITSNSIMQCSFSCAKKCYYCLFSFVLMEHMLYYVIFISLKIELLHSWNQPYLFIDCVETHDQNHLKFSISSMIS